MNDCKLCGEPRKLRNSHVFPEFLYRPSYDKKNRAFAISNRGTKATFVQKGMRERLLCDDCEQLLNHEYEQPFAKLWFSDSPLLPPKIGDEFPAIQGLDYHRFKLFHLSLLWRASVSRGESFAQTALGPHEETIRKMLLDGDAGEPRKYPLLATILVSNPGREVHAGLLMTPLRRRGLNRFFYSSAYAGCLWHIFVSKQPLPDDFKNQTLSSDGRILVAVRDILEFDPIRNIYRDYFSQARKKNWRLPWVDENA